MINKIFESAPTINNNENYWIKRGKYGKKCMIFFHDDLDGIMSAIVVKQYLQNNNFDIIGYGVVNYVDSWNNINLDKRYINISVDFAEDHPDLDIYIDHHGKFEENGGDIKRHSIRSVKTSTGSAYEGICKQLGVKTDSLILDVIDMVDSAKYEFYDVDIETILNFDLDDILNSNNPKLVFAGAFNQLIKRGDYKTLIEVAHNSSLSILNIYLMFKKLFPLNNLNRQGQQTNFVEDGKKRVSTMINRVRGKNPKKIYKNQKKFFDDKWDGKKISRDGYEIIGKLVFIPNGTWANALRAKAIISQDLKNNSYLSGHKIYFLLLQYGSSLQISDTIGMENIPDDDMVILDNGLIVNNLGNYTNEILKTFRLDYNYSKDITKSGGHVGIGNVSNIVGVNKSKSDLNGLKWVDIFKNKIINDLSGIDWKLDMVWEPENVKSEIDKDSDIKQKILMISDIRIV